MPRTESLSPLLRAEHFDTSLIIRDRARKNGRPSGRPSMRCESKRPAVRGWALASGAEKESYVPDALMARDLTSAYPRPFWLEVATFRYIAIAPAASPFKRIASA